jgi:NAD(P)-dependent dehydrogenase (short-subunit alcohol dehydrogenase family)
MTSLNGHVAFITGCGRLTGIGRGVANALARAGADLVLADVSAGGTRNRSDDGEDEAEAGWQGLPSLAAEAGQHGVRVATTIGDVGVRSDAERMVEEGIRALGKVDILVNNAAAPSGADRRLTWEVPDESFDEVMRVNFKGVFLMSTAVARRLVELGSAGRIINISSALGLQPTAKRAVYAAAKAAGIAMMRAMAIELGPHGVTVNAVLPGQLHTSRQGPARQAKTAVGYQDVPVGRITKVEDIARAVVFLADPESDYITGECLNVNGGAFFL